MLKSKYELAVNSIYDLKKDRIENAIAFTKQVEREVPNSANAKTATDLRTKLEKEKVSFIELEKKVEARKKELQDKQREAEAKQNQEKDLRDAVKKGEQAARDSAKAATPASSATFPIRK